MYVVYIVKYTIHGWRYVNRSNKTITMLSLHLLDSGDDVESNNKLLFVQSEAITNDEMVEFVRDEHSIRALLYLLCVSFAHIPYVKSSKFYVKMLVLFVRMMYVV